MNKVQELKLINAALKAFPNSKKQKEILKKLKILKNENIQSTNARNTTQI